MRLNQEKELKRRWQSRNLWRWTEIFRNLRWLVFTCGKLFIKFVYAFFTRRAVFFTRLLVFILIFTWIFSGWPEIWQNPRIPPKIQKTQAAMIAQYSGGLLVYADTATVGTPKYKVFDDTTGFGAEQNAASVGASAINWIRVAASPINDEWIIATRDAGNVIKAQVCTGVDGGVSCGTPTTITATAGTHGFRNFDVAYEQSSGHALLVYGTATVDELRKIEWTGSWGGDEAITTTRTAGAVEWVELTSRPSTDQIGIAYSDTADAISAYRWSGTAVGNEATANIGSTAITANVRKFDVSFEGTSGDMLVVSWVAGAGTARTGALTAAGTWTIGDQTTVDVAMQPWIDLQEPGQDDDIAVIAVGSAASSNLSEGFEWNGTGVTDGNNGDDAAANWAASYQLGAVSWFNSTYYGVAVFSSAAAGTGADDIDWWTMAANGGITDQAANARTRGAAGFIDLFDYPNADKVLLITADVNSDLWADTWDGASVTATAWTDLTSGGALETDLAIATKDVVDFAFRLAPIPITTLSTETNPGDSSLAPEGSITSVNGFTLTTNVGTDAIIAIIVNLSTNSGVGTLTITNGADTALGSIGGGTGSGIVTGSNSISITSTNATTGGTAFKVKVTPLSHINMPPPDGGSYAITGVVTDWTGTNTKNGQANDTSSTVTIDNDSPAATTGASATPGDTMIDVGWTPPGDSDFQQIYIYCKTSSMISGEAPIEGTDPTIDETACDGTARLKYKGTASPQTITGLTNDTLYYFRIYARDNNGNFTAYASTQEVSATPVAVGFSIAIEVRAQDYTTSVSNIIFPESVSETTVSQPYNNIDGSGNPQTFGGTGSAKPVVTLYNGGASTLTVWYNITTFTNSVVSSEYYKINNKGASLANEGQINSAVTFDTDTTTGTTIAVGAGNEKDFYLKITLGSSAKKSGNSTLAILGEAL